MVSVLQTNNSKSISQNLMTTTTFSGQVLNAPFTAFQIELICNAVELYKFSGYNSKDLEYLEQQLVLYRSMLLERHRQTLEEKFS